MKEKEQIKDMQSYIFFDKDFSLYFSKAAIKTLIEGLKNISTEKEYKQFFILWERPVYIHLFSQTEFNSEDFKKIDTFLFGVYKNVTNGNKDLMISILEFYYESTFSEIN